MRHLPLGKYISITSHTNNLFGEVSFKSFKMAGEKELEESLKALGKKSFAGIPEATFVVSLTKYKSWNVSLNNL